ncbi:cysteine--tRNA ligase [Rhizobium sp. Leaf384]|uniref:cysteine--tRNA ligase n=1 Tax=unclassified Rhizobium TaxID=2613769 RepID=UPI0007152652|nr:MULTISPECIES: cysteine--tRNA ligase [unclassified Rhizobium]KQS80528.1 cysteine--tRNA ligase [Rhizobium sp. Leaf384]KQS86579.1 cysteine--tRNA ligase [Rhizobium sp. Leaf383]
MTDVPALRLYNTLTREKAVFTPIDAEDVRLYVCGPTVYDFAHIGNARPVIVFDVLFRLLRHLYGEAKVTYVRNITDVDDKINARALRDFPDLPLNDAIRAVTEKTETQFLADARALGSLEPTVQPRATDNIAEMIAIIEALIARGHAYVAAGEVLFDTTSMADYGALSHRNLDEQQAGARVAVDAHKKSPGDFVLWKMSSENEPGWDSPWGRGRPGWHIECSAMSHRYLGETFDIHGGGLDLIFPHHENEIAQSRCAHGTSAMANVWMHNGFVQIEGRKMSKSDGNFVTIHALLHTEEFGGRAWPGEVLRLAMLMTQYRQPIDFSLKRLEEAQGIMRRWADAKPRVEAVLAGRPDARAWTLPADSPVLDDLNLYPVITGMNQLAAEAAKGDLDAAAAFLGLLDLMGFEAIEHLSQQANDRASGHDDEETRSEVNRRIAQRLDLLKARNFAEADRIRDELLTDGIQLKDGKDAETGERVTTWEIRR